MARVGRKAAPTALKLLRGNPGRRPLNAQEPQPAPTTADPPGYLTDPLALEVWHEVAPECVRLGVLTSVDRRAFAAACEQMAMYRRAMDAMAHVYTRESPNNGRIAMPDVAIAHKALDKALGIFAGFGVGSAGERSRIKAGTAPPADEFEAFASTRTKA